MNSVIGIDIGGTAAKLGIVLSNGEIVEKDRAEIDAQASFMEIVTPIVDKVRELQCHTEEIGRCRAIGLCAPGFTNKANGVLVEGSKNIPAFEGKSLVNELKNEFRMPVFADNDATAAAAAELLFGAGKKYIHFALITLGTGIGGGLVLDGKVYRGSKGFAGEIGHICVDPNGRWCNCGSRGCFEQYASGTALVRVYAEKLRKRKLPKPDALTARKVVYLAQRNDPLAVESIDEIARFIAQVFGGLINALNLEACIIGGGMSQAGDVLLQPIRRNIMDFTWPLLVKDVKVMAAKLQNDAGLLGAAAQAFERLEE